MTDEERAATEQVGAHLGRARAERHVELFREQMGRDWITRDEWESLVAEVIGPSFQQALDDADGDPDGIAVAIAYSRAYASVWAERVA